MKRIGIIGGLSAESTAVFYLAITRAYTAQFGTAAYPEMVLYSVSFEPMLAWANTGHWDRFADGLLAGIRAVARGGADFAVIAANMPHRVFDQVVAQSPVPLLHIADAVATRAGALGCRRVALLGTRATMAASFYPERLEARAGIATLVPDETDQIAIQTIIERELVRGVITPESTQRFQAIIHTMAQQGAEAVVLGCTEIPLLISDANSPLPVLDSTQLFAERTLQEAVGQSE